MLVLFYKLYYPASQKASCTRYAHSAPFFQNVLCNVSLRRFNEPSYMTAQDEVGVIPAFLCNKRYSELSGKPEETFVMWLCRQFGTC